MHLVELNLKVALDPHLSLPLGIVQSLRSKLWKKSSTLLERARQNVPEFDVIYKKLKRSVELSGKSQSTLTNYARCLAHIALHFNCSPLELDREQLLDYLHDLKSRRKTPSDIFFKHTVYGLRYLYRVYGLPEHRVVLPSIERPKKLPVVLSKRETRLLIRAPKLHRHRLMLALLYGCGLRSSELRGLHIKDVDMDREQLHVRQGELKLYN